MGLFSTLFGGSKQKSSSSSQSTSHQESGNLNYTGVTNAFGGPMWSTHIGEGALRNILGLGTPVDHRLAQENFRTTPGYQFAFDEGMRMVNGSMASRGLFNSGKTLRSLQERGMGLADQTYNNYLSQLFNYASGGLGAGDLVTRAGQYSRADSQSSSKSKSSGSSSNGGLLNLFGGFAAL